MLAQVEGHVSVNYIDTRNRRPHNLTKLLSKEEISAIREKDKKLQKLFDDFEDMYSAAYEAGIRIEPDKFGGFCLVNRTGRVIRIGEIVSTVGLLGKKKKGQELDEWSMMEGEKLLVGVARWANHSCRPNCDYYMSSGFRGRECVRLRALHKIEVGEELLTFYSKNSFGDGNRNCLCGYKEAHVDESLEREDVLVSVQRPKRRRKVKTLIKISCSDERASQLSSMIRFYDEEQSECSAAGITSDNTSLSTSACDRFFESDSPTGVEPDASLESEFESFHEEEESFVESERLYDYSDYSFSSEGSNQENISQSDTRQRTRITEVCEVTPVNLAASLVAIVSKHNGSDSLLADLLKRDQKIFSNQSLPPYAVKTRMQKLCLQYQNEKKT